MAKDSGLTRARKIAREMGLEGESENSFAQLCHEGCDPDFLASLFPTLHSKPIKVTPADSRRGPYEVSLRPMDDWSSAIRGFTPRELDQVAKKLNDLCNDITELNASPIMRKLEKHEVFGDKRQVVFGLPGALQVYETKVIPLLLEQRKRSGPRQRPDYTIVLAKIYAHIQDHTGQWHDALVADILSNLYPDQKYQGEEALKEWRLRHKETIREVTQKEQNL